MTQLHLFVNFLAWIVLVASGLYGGRTAIGALLYKPDALEKARLRMLGRVVIYPWRSRLLPFVVAAAWLLAGRLA